MSWIKSQVYHAPSSSGGKVWIVPMVNVAYWTIAGKMSAYQRGFGLNTFALNNPKDPATLVAAKLKKGYSYLEDVWVESGTFRISRTDPSQNSQQEDEAVKSHFDALEASFGHIEQPGLVITGDGVFDF
jgi:hypothetical protein